ncbi:MAG TPA: hypothetical protein VLE96_01955 [Chlamydiales bacterium]|nr:hypothetical protein [Chlamydiales bacterium]
MFESTLSLGKLCQLALSQGKDGEPLAAQILPLVHFPSLWSRENEYNRSESQSSINLLLRAFGKAPFYHDPTPSHLRFLEQSLPTFKESSSETTKAFISNFSEKIRCAFVKHGEYVALGAMNCSSIEIPAFGTQLHPLNDPQMFGVHRTDAKWSAVSVQKEIWFEYQNEESGFSTRFVGITTDVPVFFVFYVKAELAFIGNDIFPPKSLQRYHHHSQKVTFQSHGDRLTIENLCPSKMQLIPLAGSGCFWDSDFLIAYEVPVHDPRTCFRFS